MIEIKKFDDQGLRRVKTDILNFKYPDRALLQDPQHTENCLSAKIDENKKFNNRYEFAKYIHERLNKAKPLDPDLHRDIGLWTWLTVLYIEQFAKDRNGNLKYGDVLETYILSFEKNPYDLSYRNIAYSCYKAYDEFGDDMKFIFGNKPKIYGATSGEFWEQCLSGPLMFENKNIFKLAKRLYQDKLNNGFAKPNLAAKTGKKNGNWIVKKQAPFKGQYQGYGSIRRFIEVTKQIVKKHRYKKMTVNDLYNLLPTEFHNI